MLMQLEVNVLYHSAKRLAHELLIVNIDSSICINMAVTEIFDILQHKFPEMYQKCRFWNIYTKDREKWNINFSKDNWIQLLSDEHKSLDERLIELKQHSKFVKLMLVGLPIQKIAYTSEVVHLSSLCLQRLHVSKPHLFKPPPLNYGLEVAMGMSTWSGVSDVDNCKEIFLRLADQFLTAREASTMGLVRSSHPLRVDSRELQLELEYICNTLATTVSMFGTGVESIVMQFGHLSHWRALLGSGCGWLEFAKQAKEHTAAQATLREKSVDQWLRYIEGPKTRKRKAKGEPAKAKVKPAKAKANEVEIEDQELEQTLRNMEQCWKVGQRAPLDSAIYKAIQNMCL